MDVSGRIAQSLGTSASGVSISIGVCWAAGIHPEYIGQYNEQKGNRCWRRSMMHFPVIMQREQWVKSVYTDTQSSPD